MNSLLESSLRQSGRPANGSASAGIHGARLRVCFAILALLVLATFASAQDAAYPQAASVVQPLAYVSLQPVPRGRLFDIAVVAKITPGFHVNAHEPSEEYLIATKVTADLPPG